MKLKVQNLIVVTILILIYIKSRVLSYLRKCPRLIWRDFEELSTAAVFKILFIELKLYNLQNNLYGNHPYYQGKCNKIASQHQTGLFVMKILLCSVLFMSLQYNYFACIRTKMVNKLTTHVLLDGSQHSSNPLRPMNHTSLKISESYLVSVPNNFNPTQIGQQYNQDSVAHPYMDATQAPKFYLWYG